MSVLDILDYLNEKNISIDAEGDKLIASAPPGALNPEILKLLNRNKQALLDILQHGITPAMLPLVRLTQAEIDRIVAHVPQGRVNVQDIYPLAPLQEGILFHHLLDTQGDAYLSRSMIAFDSRARLDSFLNALQIVIERHDILRTAIHWEGLPQPVQVVCREATLPIQEITLHADREAGEQLLELTDPRHTRIDLQRAPLFAAYVAHDLRCDEWLLALLAHHIVCDHVSLEIILAEIQLLLQGQGHRLPPSLPYRNFIAQMRAIPDDEHIEYFRTQLADVDAPTAPFGVLDVQSDGGSVVEARLFLNDDLAQSIRAAARRHGVTAAVLFHVAWAQVLAICCGRDDVVFGTVLLGRLQATEGAGQALGMFINTLPLRIHLAGRSVQQAVADAHQRLSELLRHEQAPLALAQRCSAVTPGLPLFTTLLNYRHTHGSTQQNADPGAPQAWAGMRMLAGEERSNYPISIDVDDLAAGFGLTAQCTQGVDADRIAAYLHAAMASLVRALAHEPQQKILGLAVLPAAERQQVLTQWNATEAPYPKNLLVQQLFEAQAAIRPGAPAVVHEDVTLSYGELNARANRLAHHLLAGGVRPDDRVAICVERSTDMVVGLLGILKAGCAYVPLDPNSPTDRLAFMLEDTAPVAVLVQAQTQKHLPPCTVPLIVLDANPVVARQRDDNPQPPSDLTVRHLAYVIYTSGSTGLPKGVMVEHANLTNLIHAHIDACELTPLDRVLQFASLGFDSSVAEIFPALGAGAAIVLRPSHLLAPDSTFSEFLQAQRITVADLPTAFWHRWSNQLRGGQERCSDSLRLVIVSGEKAELRHLADWLVRPNTRHCRWLNNYGPTEATVNATSVSFDSQAALPESELPIGRPIANAKIYLLDAHRQPVPIGVTGEIYIGGAGVARGYLNRAELTEERFLSDPFAATADARMYKTGDLARYRADGNIEFLGRNDLQIKLRGFRIEPGEIEAQLLAYQGVQEAAVIAREDTPDNKRLVAYLVSQENVVLDIAELRNALAATLPEYMIPAAFVRLERLPLTPNGKLDRKALPAPEGDAYLTRTYEPPQGAIEQGIATIWQELLGVERVGRRDHFFQLGGHSLLAVQLISRVRQVLGLEVVLRQLFVTPVLADFAEHLRTATASRLPAVQPADRSQPLPLSWAQQRLWFLNQLDPAAGAAYHLPLALRLHGQLDRAALQATLDRLITRHEVLRTTFIKSAASSEPVQLIAPADTPFALSYRDLRALEESEQRSAIEHLGHAESTRSFDLAQGPLIRAQLLQLAAEDHVLLLTQHHIVTDGWSIGVLIHEVAALYGAFSRGEPDPLPPLPIQYADYAVWQRQWLQGETLEAQLDFWRQHLHGAPALLELPVDHPRPAVQSYAGASVPFLLSTELTAGLKALAQRHGGTLFMTLLAGWSVLLARMSGQSDVVIGTPVANRQRTEIEALIGFFVNTLALRVQLDDGITVHQCMERVKALTLDAYANQEVPFEQVVEALQPQRSLSHNAVFQVMLSLQNTSSSELELPGLSFAPVELSYAATRFDLSLSMMESGDEIAGNLTYATALFERSSVARLAAHFHTLLSAMVADEAQRIGDLPLLGSDERRRMLEEWNANTVAYPRAALVHQLFEAQAETRPDAVAVLDEDTALSYGELNRHANRVAHYLLSLGLRPDDRVVLCMERSLDMIIGILGVLKAGGAYVPVDPSYPQERLAFMLQDSAAVAVLTHSAARANLPSLHMPVATLDPGSALWRQPDHNPDPVALGLNSAHLAYVLYTSGSTGRPKGVMVEHRNVVQLIVANAYVTITPEDCIAHCANPVFDASTWEIWGPLLHGARLLVISPTALRDPAIFAEVLRTRAANFLHLTTGLLNQYADALADCFARLDYLLFGGQQANPSVIARILEHSPPRHLINCYGPTECTVFATTFDFAAAAEGARTVCIGRPIANAKIYLLDARRQPVPIGVVGEIYIGGSGVSRGYLRLPELTEQRFLEDPFAGTPGARMYKTGDLARYRADGLIEYLGRNDLQVKVRGFRIELGEIEAKLVSCPGIREAVVIAREDTPDDQRLVAYLLTQGGVMPSAAELRAQLSTTLAEYMIPAAYVILDSFPLTPNGKLDRRALPAPDQHAYITRTYEAPSGAVETTIAEVWKELLGHAQIGRNDHFFDLGGHSLLAVRFASRVSQALGIEVTLRELFAEPTLAGFAAAILNRAQRILHPSLCPIRPNGNSRPLFLLHPAGGEVAYARDLAPHLDPDLPVYGLAARGVLAGETPLQTIEESAAFYIHAIRQVQPRGPYRLAGYSSGGILAYEIANQLIGADETVEFLGLIDTSYKDGFSEQAPPPDETTFLLQWCKGQLHKSTDPALLEELETLAAAADLDAMLGRAQAAGLIAADIDGNALRRYLAVYIASDIALSRYAVAPIPAQVSLFVSAEHPEHPDHPGRPENRSDTEAGNDPAANARPEPWNAWKKMAAERLRIIPIGGDHETIMTRPHIQHLASSITASLAKTAATPPVYAEQSYSPLMTISTGRSTEGSVFCVPGAAASITVFCSLTDTLDLDMCVYGLQPRGLDTALVPHIDIPSAARAYLRAIRAARPKGPYHLLGHSFGGWVVFEIARQLRASGDKVDSLILLDTEAPSSEIKTRYQRVPMLLKLIELFELSAKRSLSLTAQDLAPLHPDDQLALLLKRLIEAKLMPPSTHLKVLRNLVRVFATNLNTSYAPDSVYDGPVHLVDVVDTDDPQDLLSAWRPHAPHATLWRAPGNHMTLLTVPHVTRLADRLRPLFNTRQ